MKKPQIRRGHSAVQVFPGAIIDAKVFEVPDASKGVIGATRELVGLTFSLGDAILTGRHEPRPIRYGGDVPQMLQMIFPRQHCELIIGVLAGLRDLPPENLLVKPGEAPPDPGPDYIPEPTPSGLIIP